MLKRLEGLLLIAMAVTVLAPVWIVAWVAKLFSPITAPVGRRLQLATGNQRGAMSTRITMIILGVITIVVGLVLETTILSQAATAGSSASIGSFSGAQSLNDLVPLIYNAAVVMLGVGMMAIGAAGFAGKGPTA